MSASSSIGWRNGLLRIARAGCLLVGLSVWLEVLHLNLWYTLFSFTFLLYISQVLTTIFVTFYFCTISWYFLRENLQKMRETVLSSIVPSCCVFFITPQHLCRRSVRAANFNKSSTTQNFWTNSDKLCNWFIANQSNCFNLLKNGERSSITTPQVQFLLIKLSICRLSRIFCSSNVAWIHDGGRYQWQIVGE